MPTRRELLRAACAAGVGVAFPGLLHAGGVAPTPDWERSLIVIELDGGNDGLNTIVPWQDPVYQTKRSSLRIGQVTGLGMATFRTGAATTATGQLGLNLALAPLLDLWSAGEMAVALGLGMAAPNRSHFRGIDIWNTGTSSSATATDGWLQRAVGGAATPGAEFAAHAVLMARASSNPIAGAGVRTLAMQSPERFIADAARLAPLAMPASNAALQHVVRTNNDVVASRQLFEAKVGTPPSFSATFPTGAFGDQCRSVAQMIAAGLKIPIYKLHLSGFDTHSDQADRHAALLTQLGQGIAAIRAALDQSGWWTRTLITTYSEFGRRVEQNGSGGTDHGTAAPHLVFGHAGNINGGLFGVQPGLAYLDGRGDLRETSDYRRLYATAVRFLGYDATAALGATFDRIGEGAGEATPLLKP
ncbi:MAG TPA: DUF1501 domain-containing protein [Planctomycetota bacterium]|nr:DUF1501 domain-containing protein [Planctomycetota bacterium]